MSVVSYSNPVSSGVQTNSKGMSDIDIEVYVRVDDALDDELVIMDDVRTKTTGSGYNYGNSNRPEFVLKTRNITRVDPYAFKITYHYTNDFSEIELENPLAMATVWSTENEGWERDIFRDKNGKPIVNTIGERFIPFQKMDANRFTIIAKKNLSVLVNPAWQNVINESAWNITPLGWTASARTLKLTISGSSKETRNGVNYYPTEFRFAYATDTDWKLRLANSGTYYLSGGKKLSFVSSDGQPLKDGLLDAGGSPLAPGSNAHLLTFSVYNEIDFGDLGLF